MATWVIEPNQNNGYPVNLNFLVGSISNRWQEGNYNLTNWRIKTNFDVSALNTGILAPIVESPNVYPHIWAATQVIGSGGGGEEGEGDIMETGGHSRPTRRYSTVPQGHMATAHHDHRTTQVSATSTRVAVSVNGYITDTAGLNALRSDLNSFPTSHAADMIAVSQIYGANIYNSVILARAFPFEIPHLTGGSGITSMNVVLAPTTQYHYLGQASAVLDFGTINLDISQGFEISKYTYKIYLPYSGVHSIDIRGNEDIQLIGYVDLFAGSIDYVLFVYDQIELTAQGKIGIDIPFNTQHGEMLQNTIINSIKYTGKTIETVAAPMGSAVGAGLGGVLGGSGLASLGAKHGRAGGEALASAGGAVADMVSGLTVPLSSSNVSGGCSSADMCQTPFIIVKKQAILDEANGYPEEVGYKRSTAVNDLTQQEGWIKCINYKCGVDRATEAEKAEIIRLMESGVLL